MATTVKTILSDLEEDACKKERLVERKDHCFNGGDNDTVDDSSIFKSFFESNDTLPELISTAPLLTQEHNLKDGSAVQKMFNPPVCSSSLSNHSVISGCMKETVMPDLAKGIETECEVKDEASSKISQHEIQLYEKLMNGEVSQFNASKSKDCFKSENVPTKEGNVHDDETEKLEIPQETKLRLDQIGSDCSDLSNIETHQAIKESSLVCKDICTKNQDLNKNTQAGDMVKELKVESELNVLTKETGDSCKKENSTNEEATSMNHISELHAKDPCKLMEEKCLPSNMNGMCDRNPLCDKIVNIDELNHEPKNIDPFTLSGDEDFSPKAYKPIKRKLDQHLVGLKAHNHKVAVLDDPSNLHCDEKRQKLIGEDLSLPDMSGRKPVCVAYVYSKELVDKANKLIRIEGRAELVHNLIKVYGILQHVVVTPPRLATETEIVGFHCSEYIQFLKMLKDSDDLSDSASAEAEAYGLSYDCPVQEDVFETASLISGATITAAETLVNGTASIAINWCGGWHHAKRDSASGFCYINDIVLGILKLRESFDKVLYVDLDLHHGDGVEEAFCMTPKVMTVSFHKYAFGFFPGSGSLEDTGSGKGRLYSVNVPLMDGIGDGQFFSIFTSIIKKVREKFSTNAIVIQCGADGLSEDPMASFNLTHVAIAKCVCFLLTWNLPTLLLGGGGYNFANTAKCWTFLTAMAAGKKLPVDIPEHENLMEYGPSFELTTSKGNRKDCNTKEHFYEIMAKICKNLNCL